MDAYASAEEVARELDNILDEFNKNLGRWYKKTQCEANFRWNYNHMGEKFLTKETINYPIYRTPPSNDEIKRASEILSRNI